MSHVTYTIVVDADEDIIGEALNMTADGVAFIHAADGIAPHAAALGANINDDAEEPGALLGYILGPGENAPHTRHTLAQECAEEAMRDAWSEHKEDNDHTILWVADEWLQRDIDARVGNDSRMAWLIVAQDPNACQEAAALLGLANYNATSVTDHVQHLAYCGVYEEARVLLEGLLDDYREQQDEEADEQGDAS